MALNFARRKDLKAHCKLSQLIPTSADCLFMQQKTFSTSIPLEAVEAIQAVLGAAAGLGRHSGINIHTPKIAGYDSCSCCAFWWISF